MQKTRRNGLKRKKNSENFYDTVRLDFASEVIFTRESSYCFQRVLATAILSVCPSVRLSVTRVDQSKTVQARITKSLPSGAWKTLVSGTVKLSHKFVWLTPNEGAK